MKINDLTKIFYALIIVFGKKKGKKLFEKLIEKIYS